MALGQSIGHPFIHENVQCDGCGKSSIRGNRFKSERRSNYDLCGKCFRSQPTNEQLGFVKFPRAHNCLPFQILYVECRDCGAAPIQGPYYQHRRNPGSILCPTCYLFAVNSDKAKKESPAEYTIQEGAGINCNRPECCPVIHFEICCRNCKVSPICGPRFKAKNRNLYEDLCLLCFDTMLMNRSITTDQFHEIPKPDSRDAINVYIYSCNQCGVTPICGPAYTHQTNRNKALCLMCFYNSHEKAQYTRVDPPRQCPAPQLTQEEQDAMNLRNEMDQLNLCHQRMRVAEQSARIRSEGARMACNLAGGSQWEWSRPYGYY